MQVVRYLSKFPTWLYSYAFVPVLRYFPSRFLLCRRNGSSPFQSSLRPSRKQQRLDSRVYFHVACAPICSRIRTLERLEEIGSRWTCCLVFLHCEHLFRYNGIRGGVPKGVSLCQRSALPYITHVLVCFR